MKSTELHYILGKWFPDIHTIVCRVNTLDLSTPGVYIVNTDCHKGKHWVAFYVTEDIIEFFDSYGRHPKHLENHKLFMQAIGDKKLIVHTKWLQSYKKVCGVYCLAFLFARVKWNDVSRLFSMFTRNKSLNDDKIIPIVNNMLHVYMK